MSRNELPKEWADLAERAGVTQSMGGIARAIGKPTSTISRMIGRSSVPTAETVGQVAQLLGVEPQQVWELVGRGGREGLGRWSPPEEAHDFDTPARDALNKIIRVMAEGAFGAADPAQKRTVTRSRTKPVGSRLPPEPNR